MTDSIPDPFDKPPGYLRPNDRWLCGYEHCGQACELGPTLDGYCQIPRECQPMRLGDQWQCGRLNSDGGPCDSGPTVTGACSGTRNPCSPVPSIRTKRERFIRYCLAVTICALAVWLGSSYRREFLAPGPLTQAHAQLFSRDNTRRCEACHGERKDLVADWLSPFMSASQTGPTQTEQCINCHINVTPKDSGKLPHGLARELLVELSRKHAGIAGGDVVSRPSPGDSQGNLPCATCHREHHGADFDLTAMTDKQCQTCHQRQFASLQSGHPEFGSWPYPRRTRIQFDHVSHAFRHFKEKGSEFGCQSCHVVDPEGGVLASPSFESCASCHEGPIQLSATQGIELLRLPSLDVALLREQGLDLKHWPESISLDFDGTLPPLMWELLRGLKDPQVDQAVAALGTNFDFLDTDPDDASQLKAVVDLVAGIEKLFVTLEAATAAGSDPIVGSESNALRIFGLIPFDVATALQKAWFRPGEQANPNQAHPAILHDWQRDDVLFVLRYVPARHADLQAKLILDQAAAWAGGNVNAISAAVAGVNAPGLCRSCHSIEYSPTSRNELAFQWRGNNSGGSSKLTHFEHGPHLQLPGFTECSACHGLNESPSASGTYATADPSDFSPQFTPIQRESCISCHTPQGAGSKCTVCHRYHAHP